MSFWGRVFGTEEALNTAVESVRDGLDALVYTDEEKANDAAKSRTEARAMVVEWMKATQGQNLARRLIALSITGTWLLMYLVSAVISMSAPFIDGVGFWTYDRVIHAGQIAAERASDMNPAVMLILAFYFAATHMGDLAKVALTKMKGGK